MTERIFLSPPHVGDAERAMLLDAFDSNWVAPLGPHVDAFEAEMAGRLGVRRAVALSSGTAALHLALLSLGVGEGDTVLVPTMTFAATANAVTYVGAHPVFVDSDPSTWCLDPVLVEAELKRRQDAGEPVAAIVTVDLYGQCCDYDALTELSDRYGIPLIEDAAEALGSSYRGKAAGAFGAAGVLSFNGNKILTTSGGGMLVTDRDDIADAAKHLATQAREPVLHYEHRDIGYNYRLSNLLAAVGRAQLAQLDERVEARQRINDRYARAFEDVAGLSMMPVAGYGTSNCWLTCVVVEQRLFGATSGDVIEQLSQQNIEARPTWKPMHLQPVFRKAETVGGSVGEQLFRNGICLPSGSALTLKQQERVVQAVLGTPSAAGRSRP
jgi:dTDP-4-amino-4,6-dideoxygalactose transaminase